MVWTGTMKDGRISRLDRERGEDQTRTLPQKVFRECCITFKQETPWRVKKRRINRILMGAQGKGEGVWRLIPSSSPRFHYSPEWCLYSHDLSLTYCYVWSVLERKGCPTTHNSFPFCDETLLARTFESSCEIPSVKRAQARWYIQRR